MSDLTSLFLFGPRGAGKTSFLKEQYSSKNTLWIDLLDPELGDRFVSSPNQLLAEIESFKSELQWVVIDEVQKCPKLLNIVRQQIESKGLKFAQIGSSAKRLGRTVYVNYHDSSSYRWLTGGVLLSSALFAGARDTFF